MKTINPRSGFFLLALAVLTVQCSHRESSDALVLSPFPIHQQTTDYTCGPVSALMVLEFYGDTTESETSLAQKMHCHVDGSQPDAPVGSAICFTDYGTNICEMYDYFDSRTEFRIVDSSIEGDSAILGDSTVLPPHFVGNHPPRFHSYGEVSRFFSRQLRAGHPILVCWDAWGGHWGVVIGLDDRGTSDEAEDDLLILADPYDTFDGKSDSRVSVPLALFFHEWYCSMTPKPNQLQPFLIVEPC